SYTTLVDAIYPGGGLGPIPPLWGSITGSRDASAFPAAARDDGSVVRCPMRHRLQARAHTLLQRSKRSAARSNLETSRATFCTSLAIQPAGDFSARVATE